MMGKASKTAMGKAPKDVMGKAPKADSRVSSTVVSGAEMLDGLAKRGIALNASARDVKLRRPKPTFVEFWV